MAAIDPDGCRVSDRLSPLETWAVNEAPGTNVKTWCVQDRSTYSDFTHCLDAVSFERHTQSVSQSDRQTDRQRDRRARARYSVPKSGHIQGCLKSVLHVYSETVTTHIVLK